MSARAAAGRFRLSEVVIRPARAEDAAGIARVHVLSWRSTYQGILPERYLGSLSFGGREREWRQHLTESASKQITLVADAGESGIVGFAEGGPEREGVAGFDGELNALYILKDWQRRGLGRQLVTAFARELDRRGHKAMIIWVLARNPSREFYMALGGVEVAKELEVVGTTVHEKVAYGWRSLAHLLG